MLELKEEVIDLLEEIKSFKKSGYRHQNGSSKDEG